MKIVATLSKTEGFPCSLAIIDANLPAGKLRTLETFVAYEEDGQGVIELLYLNSASPLLLENVLPRLRPYEEGNRFVVPTLAGAVQALELLASLFDGQPDLPAALLATEPPDAYSAPGEGFYDPYGFAYSG